MADWCPALAAGSLARVIAEAGVLGKRWGSNRAPARHGRRRGVACGATRPLDPDAATCRQEPEIAALPRRGFRRGPDLSVGLAADRDRDRPDPNGAKTSPPFRPGLDSDLSQDAAP